jgi:hypothetical protein
MKHFTHLAIFALFALLPFTATAQAASKVTSAAAPVSTIRDSATVVAGPRVLTGTILGVRDQPLAGATVSVVTEPNKAGITNSVGGYVLRSTAESPVLRVSYAGYKGVELPIVDSKPLVIRLEQIVKYEKDRKKRAKTAVKEYRKP